MRCVKLGDLVPHKTDPKNWFLKFIGWMDPLHYPPPPPYKSYFCVPATVRYLHTWYRTLLMNFTTKEKELN